MEKEYVIKNNIKEILKEMRGNEENVDSYGVINHIYNYVNSRNAKFLILNIPRVKDIKNKNRLQTLINSIWNDPTYKICDNTTNEGEIYYKRLSQFDRSNIVLDNIDLFDDCFYDISEYKDNKEKYIKERILDPDPIIVQDNDVLRFNKYDSKYMNIDESGIRKTPNNTDSKNNIFMFGNSVIFGLHVEDNRTISNKLKQNLLDNNKDYNVINHGMNGETILNMYTKIFNTDIKSGDIVIINYYPWLMDNNIKFNSFPILDLSKYFEGQQHECFIDQVHLTNYGNSLVSEKLFKCLFPKQNDNFKLMENLDNIEKQKYVYSDEKELDDKLMKFAEKYKKNININFNDKSINIGGIVVTCNPFTNGHKHLIKIASEMFDEVIIFFSFRDARFIYTYDVHLEMTKIGSSEFKNVHVIPMPEFFSFATFFPQYNDYNLRQNKNLIAMNSYATNYSFCKMFKYFNVKYRLFGEETDDAVTLQHMRQAQYLMPQYGVNVIVIPRKKFSNNQYNTIRPVSGTLCREYLKNKNYEAVRGFVPDNVINYLKENNFKISKEDEINKPKVNERVVKMLEHQNDESYVQELDIESIDISNQKQCTLDIRTTVEALFSYNENNKEISKSTLLNLLHKNSLYSTWICYFLAKIYYNENDINNAKEYIKKSKLKLNNNYFINKLYEKIYE